MNVPYQKPVNEDSLLIERAKAGDADAYGQIVREYQADVRAFIRSRLLDDATADDLAQEVFIGGFKSIRKFKGNSSLRSWLISIARNKLIDFIRSESRKKNLQCELQKLFDSENDLRLQQNSDTEITEMVDYLKICVESLKPQAKNLLGKFYYDDCSAVQIGNDIGQKPSSVRMHLLRIRRALAKCIRKRMGKEISL